MTERLKIIFSELVSCKKFADVGCDHGYIAKAMLDANKAERVIISDISAPSLKKAEDLLSAYPADRVKAVVCDGLSGVDGDCDQVLIAGMGGEEIVSILSAAENLPVHLVLQPMKNADKVRNKALSLGYRIVKDYVFKAGKFYFLLVCERGKDKYTDDELFFGRDNLNAPSADFKEYARKEYAKYSAVAKRADLSEEKRAEIEKIMERYGKFI